MAKPKKERLEMIEWQKKSGGTITTNAELATVEIAESLGWKRVKK